MCRFEGSLSLRRECRKRRWIVVSQVRQNLAIQLDPRFLDPIHKPAVGQLGKPRTGSDADDPQGAKIAFLEFTSDVSVFKRLLDRFLRGSVQFALGEEKALRQGECFLAALTPLSTTFNSRHVCLLIK